VEKQISMLTKAVQAAEANGFESGQPIWVLSDISRFCLNLIIYIFSKIK
jgi:hypothetical protein